jgi:hypothetical protein
MSRRASPRHAVHEELAQVARVHLVLRRVQRRGGLGLLALPLRQLQRHARVLHGVVRPAVARISEESSRLHRSAEARRAPRQVLIRKEHRRVDHRRVIETQRPQVVHETVADQHGVGLDDLAQLLLHVRERRLDALEVLHL